MCGIAGILRVTPPGAKAQAALERTPFEAIPEVWLEALDASIRHRGPDGQGRFRDRTVRADGSVVDVALVHRRLSIIDHGSGAQPMVSQLPSLQERDRGWGFTPLLFQGKPSDPVHYLPLPDLPDTLAVVFNGCIYNHHELRAQLQAAGHRFITDHSDTEVLLHGWREWGEGSTVYEQTATRSGGLFSMLEGMFAIGLWDRRAGSLILLRDQCGEKPLSCTPSQASGETWAFCSVPAGLGSQGTAGAPMPARRWLKLGFDENEPFVHPPGSARLLPESASSSLHPRPAYLPKGSSIPDWGELSQPMFERAGPLDEARAESLLRAAVERRLEADVPLGCFLSGGIDSGLVASIAQRALGRLQTFTLRMPDTRYDESAAATQTATHLGTQHTTLDCDPQPAEDLVRLITSLGVPFGDSSLLPTYWLSRAVRRHVRVALTGDGGDELFCGYNRQTTAPLLAGAAWPLSILPASLIDQPDPTSRRAKFARLIRAARSRTCGYEELAAVFPSQDLDRLAGPDTGSQWAGPRLTLWSLLLGTSIERALDWDTQVYLPHDLMRKADTASMAVALEVRAPFLDRDLYAAARSATVRSLMPGGRRKGLLRAVARRHLPIEIVERPKQGFAIPIGDWFRSDYGGLRTLLLDHLHSAEPFGPPSLGISLNRRFIQRMLDEHLGTGSSGVVKRDHSQRLYMLLVLSIWARAYSSRA